MVVRGGLAGALVGLAVLGLGCGSSVTTLEARWVEPGRSTELCGPGGRLIFSPTSLTEPVRIRFHEVDPQSIQLGKGCGLTNPVVLGAIQFEVLEGSPLTGVRAIADIPVSTPGSLLHVFYEPPMGGGFDDTGGYAPVSSSGCTAEYSDVDAGGTWAFVRPGGG